MSDREEDRIDPVHEVQILLTVYGQDSDPQRLTDWIRDMSLGHLAHEMDEGELIGATRLISTSTVPDGQVRHRLQAIGNGDASFFEGHGGGDAPPEDPGVEMRRLKEEQGWESSFIDRLAMRFVAENGLGEAFLQTLREVAEMERKASLEDTEFEP